MTNRIWIELDKSTSEEHAQKQCDLANKVLKKLGFKHYEFFPGKRGYCLVKDEAGGYIELADNGHWFNLDRAAADDTVKADLVFGITNLLDAMSKYDPDTGKGERRVAGAAQVAKDAVKAATN